MTLHPAPIDQPQQDIAWLRRLGLESAAATAIAGVAGLTVGMITGQAAFLEVGCIVAAYGGWLMLCRRWTEPGRESRYILRISAGLVAVMFLLLPLSPSIAQSLAFATLIPVFIAVPFLGRRELHRSSMTAWVLSVVYIAAASALVSAAEPEGFAIGPIILDTVGASIILGFMFLLIRRYADASETVRSMATHDGLTGLCNRALLIDRLDHARAAARRIPSTTAVVYLDIDGFKEVNDRHGHAQGDALLRVLAGRLKSAVRTVDTVARVGGDEFAVMLDGVQDAAQATVITERIRRAAALPVMLAEGEIPVRASVGVALSIDGETAEALLGNADFAMYRSKEARRGEIVTYEPSMRAADGRRRATKAALRGVVERDELALLFQPIVRINSGQQDTSWAEPPVGSIMAVEALVRWDDPVMGRRTPDEFIELAEQTGDIVPIGRWVLRAALRHVHEWRGVPNTRNLRIAVNLSARQFEQPGFEEEVLEMVASSGVAPSSLVLEITENLLLSDLPSIRGTLQTFRTAGMHLAIDDFGKGHSSFSYLKDFPIDTIKIDRSFVSGAVGSARRTALLRAMIAVGAALGATVVAEGIEDRAELALVRNLGCDLGQGFLFSAPLDASAVGALLRSGRRLDGGVPAVGTLTRPRTEAVRPRAGRAVPGYGVRPAALQLTQVP